MAKETITIQIEGKIDEKIEKGLKGIGSEADKANSSIKMLKKTLKSIGGSEFSKLISSQKKAASAQGQLAREIEKTRQAKVRTSIVNERLKVAEERLGQAIIRTNNLIRRQDQALKKSVGSFKKVSNAAAGLTRTLRTLLIFYAANQIKEAADAYTNLGNRLKLVTKTAGQAAIVQEKLFKIAVDSRTPIADVTQAFQRFDLALKGLGASQKESLRFTETLSKQLTISGLSTIEASQGLRQLSQALNKGKLDGDEFRTVMETIPTVSQAIADELGVARGELLKLAPQGVITADVIRKAMARLAEETDKRFSELTPTIGQAFTVLGNEFTKFLGEFNKATGIFDTFSKGVIVLAKNFKLLAISASAALLVMFGPAAIAKIGLGIAAMKAYIVTIGGARVALTALASKGALIGLTIAIASFGVAVAASEGEIDTLNESALRGSDIFAALAGASTSAGEGMGIFALTMKDLTGTFDILVNKFKFNIAQISAWVSALKKAAQGHGTLQDNLLLTLEVSNDLAAARVKQAKADRELVASLRKQNIENKSLAKTLKAAGRSTDLQVKKIKQLNKAFKDGEIGIEAYGIQLNKIANIKLAKGDDSGFGAVEKFLEDVERGVAAGGLEKLTKDLIEAQNARRALSTVSQGSPLDSSQRTKFTKLEDAEILKLRELHNAALIKLDLKSNEESITALAEATEKKAQILEKNLARQLRAEKALLDQARSVAESGSGNQERLAILRDRVTDTFDRQLQTQIAILQKDIEIEGIEKKIADNQLTITTLKKLGNNADDQGIEKLKEVNRLLREQITNKQEASLQVGGTSDQALGLRQDFESEGTLREKLDSELIAQEEQNEAKLNLFRSFNENIQSELEMHGITEAAIIKKNNDKIAKINNKFEDEQLKKKRAVIAANLQNLAQFAGMISNQFAKINEDREKQNKAAFIAEKAFAFAEAGLNIAGGISKALNNPYPANLIFAATVAAAGALQIANIISSSFADGGIVNGPGTGRSDSISANLSNGEFVVNASATTANRDLLEQINNGAISTSNSNPVFMAPPPAQITNPFLNNMNESGPASNNVSINIINSNGIETEVVETETDQGLQLDILTKKVGDALANQVNDQDSDFGNAIVNRIGRDF
ncbi:hypothetical protein COB55_04895 [Candidatus Wolfebacteria bacterium]|nr:MAG: hypothetical protein COB55_04895 [Candidatus Wolfebacteria bacterium]